MADDSTCGPARKSKRSPARMVASLLALAATLSTSLSGPANAEPVDVPPPLPQFIPTASNWAPKFPPPYDATRNDVAEADVTAEHEMCQWFNAQYVELHRQMDQLGFDLLHANNDWTVPGIQLEADAVASNIEQTVAFLAPRAEALTQSQDYAADNYFPMYQGESFYRLWQHLSNTGVGIRARNTAWIYGPSQQRTEHWGSRIERSHVCD
jgi:5'-3' exonuclease